MLNLPIRIKRINKEKNACDRSTGFDRSINQSRLIITSLKNAITTISYMRYRKIYHKHLKLNGLKKNHHQFFKLILKFNF